jgi:hypothetical protein
MTYPTKIATCCYCGSKTVLRFDKGRHELSCARCAAPLGDLTTIPKPVKKKRAVSHQPDARNFSKPVKQKSFKKKHSKPKRRKSWFQDFAEEAFDFLEDVFD